MNIQQINHLEVVDRSPEHAWGMALYGFMTATELVSEMAKVQPYRDMAVEDLDKLNGAVLAINLMWSQLQARRAA